jgi:hypothetical protein
MVLGGHAQHMGGGARTQLGGSYLAIQGPHAELSWQKKSKGHLEDEQMSGSVLPFASATFSNSNSVRDVAQKSEELEVREQLTMLSLRIYVVLRRRIPAQQVIR